MTIEGNEYELIHLKIYNTLGVDMSNKVDIIEREKDHLIIDLSNLPSGMYKILTTSGTYNFHKL